jgi:hypothetical protein
MYCFSGRCTTTVAYNFPDVFVDPRVVSVNTTGDLSSFLLAAPVNSLIKCV